MQTNRPVGWFREQHTAASRGSGKVDLIQLIIQIESF